MKNYRAVYEREDDGRWTVKVPQVLGCHSYGRTIDQARERIKEALSLFVEDADNIEIVDDVRLPADVKKLVRGVVKLRRNVADQERAMVEAQVDAVKALRSTLKLGHRDTGSLLGLSHQRIYQLEKRRRSGARSGRAEAPDTRRLQ